MIEKISEQEVASRGLGDVRAGIDCKEAGRNFLGKW